MLRSLKKVGRRTLIPVQQLVVPLRRKSRSCATYFARGGDAFEVFHKGLILMLVDLSPQADIKKSVNQNKRRTKGSCVELSLREVHCTRRGCHTRFPCVRVFCELTRTKIQCERELVRFFADSCVFLQTGLLHPKKVPIMGEHPRFFAVSLPLRSIRQHDHAEFFQRG